MAAWCFCFGSHGQNWFNSRTLPAGKPSAQPALSDDGRFVYWAWEGGLILSSTNWAVSWETNAIATVTNIYSIACSTNGSIVVVAANNGIYYSSTAGKEWARTTAPEHPWKSVAMSADGSKIVAADNSGTSGIYRSADSGHSWTQLKADGTWGWIASSADGSVLVAAAVQFADSSVISTNSGASWDPLTVRLYSAEMSANGLDMIAIPQSTHTEYSTSTNRGATWLSHFEGLGGSYTKVAISADGGTLAAISGATVKRYDPVLQNWFANTFTSVTSGGMSGDGKFMVVSYATAIAIWSAEAPIIVRNPVTMTVWPRTNLNLTASVVGAGPITYRWTFNDEPVGLNSSLLQWTATNSGTIKLTAANAFGSDSITYTILNVLPVGARMNIVGADNWPFGAVVAPGSSDTAVWFEWGVSNSFDHVIMTTNIPAGAIKSLTVPAPAMELGVYYVRVVASNSLGVSVSIPARYVPSPVSATMDTGARVTFNGPAFNWFERGYVATNRSLGLPEAGSIFKSESEDASYQMPANYGAPNALLVDTTSGGTLRLMNPTAFSKVSFLTSAGSGEVVIRYVLHHVDGSTQTGTFLSSDWYNGTNTAFTAHARVLPDISTPLAFPTTLWRVFTEPNNPRLYGRTIAVDNSATPIQQIELSRASGNGHAAVFAVSGSLGAGFFPIDVTGFTHDMVVEAAFSGAPAVTFNGSSGASFRARPGVQYEVRETVSLTAPNWTLLSNYTASSTAEVSLPPNEVIRPTRFFQIRPR